MMAVARQRTALSCQSTALTVAMSNLIIKEIDTKYPTISKLMEYNRPVMLHMMQAMGALTGCRFQEPLKCKRSGSGLGYKVWEEYGRKIQEYVDGLCAKLSLKGVGNLREILSEARKFLGEHIHLEYFKLLPRWPPVGVTNNDSFEANVMNSYTSGIYYVVWSCYGVINVEDTTKSVDGKTVFTANFFGDPEIKLLLMNKDKMLEFDRLCETNGIEACKKGIDKKARMLGPSELEVKFNRLFLTNE